MGYIIGSIFWFVNPLAKKFFCTIIIYMEVGMDADMTAPNITKWPARLALDTAMMLELDEAADGVEELLERYRIDAITYAGIAKSKLFVEQVNTYRDEIRNKGVTFRMKAKAQAEELLSTSWALIHHPDVSPAVKADLIKSTVKWAGLEPKGDAPAGTANGVSITINLGDKQVTAVQKIIDPLTLENEIDEPSE